MGLKMIMKRGKGKRELQGKEKVVGLIDGIFMRVRDLLLLLE